MRMSIMNNHIAIQGWMVEDLHLRGNTLIIFAIIWGFTGNLKSTRILENWSVNYRYITAWTGLCEDMIDNILYDLNADNLVLWDNDMSQVHVNSDYKM